MSTKRKKRVVFSWLSFALALVSVPAANAQVTVKGTIVSVGGTHLRGDVTLIRGGSAVEMRSYHTDGQGAFSFETNRTADQLLVAKANGHVSSEVALNTTGTVARLNVRFRLQPAGKVSGRVVDENGNGVGGATVHVRYPGELRRHHFHHEVGDIHADDFGYFTLPVVARGKSFVVEAGTAARLPASTASLTLDGEEASGVQVTAGRIGFVVRGAVRDSAANPHAGASVRLRLFPGSKTTAAARLSRLHARLLNQSTVTGPAGAYEFKGLPAGKVVLIAHVSGKTPVKQEQVLPELGAAGSVRVINLIVD